MVRRPQGPPGAAETVRTWNVSVCGVGGMILGVLWNGKCTWRVVGCKINGIIGKIIRKKS